MICFFRSILASRLQSFLDIRRAVGRDACSDAKILRYLDRFFVGELKPGQALTRQVAERWIETFKCLSYGARVNRICTLRQFCLYLSRFDKRTWLVPQYALPTRKRRAPHIYTDSEVKRIMKAAKGIGPAHSLRPAVMYTLIGLLYATGLRIGEARKLTLADVDLRRRLLTIRRTKFNKTRLVPLHDSDRPSAQTIARANILGVSSRPAHVAGIDRCRSPESTKWHRFDPGWFSR